MQPGQNIKLESLIIFLAFLAFIGCKKEADMAKKFIGNYKGILSKYDISSTNPILLQTYPDKTIAIAEIDRKTLQLTLDGSPFFTCAIESDTSFGSSSRIYGPNGVTYSHGNLIGDSLTFNYGTAGGITDYTHYVFKGARN